MQARGREGGGHAVPASGAGTLQARRSPRAHVNRRIGGTFRGLRSQRERAANARRPAQGGRVISLPRRERWGRLLREASYDRSSLPILDKGEQFPRVI